MNAQDNDGLTALMIAAKCGKEEVIEELLKRGATKDLQDTDGNPFVFCV